MQNHKCRNGVLRLAVLLTRVQVMVRPVKALQTLMPLMAAQLAQP